MQKTTPDREYPYIKYKKIIIPPATEDEIEQNEVRQRLLLKMFNARLKSPLFYFNKNIGKWERTMVGRGN